jgi:hypothetical protein
MKIEDLKNSILFLIIGVLVGKFVLPQKENIVVREVIRYEQKKEEKKDIKKDKKVTIVETTNPDGTKKKETKIDEKTDTSSTTKTDTKVSKDTEITKKNKSASIGIVAISELNKNILTKNLEYGIISSVPIVGSLSVTGLLTTDKKIGLGISLDF